MAWNNFNTDFIRPVVDYFDNLWNTGTRFFHGLSDKYLGTSYNALEQQQIAQQFSAEQADLAWQRQLQMFNLQNEYNTPAAQMSRFRAAGLNPSLLYGNSIQEAASPSAPSSASGTTASSSSSGNILDFLYAKAQLDDIQATARLKNAQADTEEALRQSRLDNLEAATANLYQQNRDIVSKIQQRAKQNEFTDAQIADIQFEQMYKTNQLYIDWFRLQNESKLTDAQIDKLKAEQEEILARARVTNREYYEMIWTFAIRMAGLEAQVHLTEAQINHANATARKLGYEADILQGPAYSEKGYAEALQGKHGAEIIPALVRSGVQMVTRDFGNIFGILK